MFPHYPFEQLIIYNQASGQAYVTWRIHRSMRDKGPYFYKLQVARTPNANDPEWEDVTGFQNDVAYLIDPGTPVYGHYLDKYYRVILKTGENDGEKTYISPAYGIFGQLRPREWEIAKDIRRRERLRYGYTAVPVTVYKLKRYGETCPHCVSDQSEGCSNSKCPYCYGTGYVGGYHAGFGMQMMDISPSQIKEIHYSDDVATFNTSQDAYQARAAGIPELCEGDIIVDESTDQRFKVSTSPVIAQIRRVPLVREVDMTLLPFSDIAYTISDDRIRESEGCGSTQIDEDYPEKDSLKFVDEDGLPVEGATVTIKDSSDDIVFTTTTTSSGKWASIYMAEPGEYTVSLQSAFDVEPIDVSITVEDIEETSGQNSEPDQTEIDYLHPFT